MHLPRHTARLAVIAAAALTAATVLTAPAVAATTGFSPAPSTGSVAAPTVAQQNAAHDHVMGSSITAPAGGSTTAAADGSVRVHAMTATAGPSSTSIRGFDVSAWQPNSSINWSTAATKGARFAYIKATEATTYTSSQFASQWSSSAAAGILHGAYVFATPNTASGAATADYFLAHGGRWTADGQTLPPLLDIESNPYGAACYGLSPAAMTSWIQSFTAEMVKQAGRVPAVYTSVDWWKTCTGNSAAFGKNPYMPAYWPSTNFSGPGTLGASWKSWNVWQWADSGTFPGDQDVFNGTAAALAGYASNRPVVGAPVGGLDQTAPVLGGVTVRGWAADTSSTASTKVTVSVNGKTVATLSATASRPDVAIAYPGIGDAHGFTGTVNATPGKDRICVVAYTLDKKKVKTLGCSTVSVGNASPDGSYNGLSATAGSVTVRGWAFDPEQPSVSTDVRVTVGGTTAGTIHADGYRPDVNAAKHITGNHGYNTAVPTTKTGTQSVCVTAINIGRGADWTTGCRTVTIPAAVRR
ncbi:GH25 family lysozyme [Curtobacterium sp. ISL-83]|uniref:GH25 family lysozyme n=1 Tax=Curtobacterium sp. ISL-83 TaxID=2819145 RepID=UPI001BE9D00E|nr:GH25 family lysozyme [Curtobacterium sp. ISL-83]MBT2502583.1 hypothetical protein [Curtobacterium sp. ISL-83]